MAQSCDRYSTNSSPHNSCLIVSSNANTAFDIWSNTYSVVTIESVTQRPAQTPIPAPIPTPAPTPFPTPSPTLAPMSYPLPPTLELSSIPSPLLTPEFQPPPIREPTPLPTLLFQYLNQWQDQHQSQPQSQRFQCQLNNFKKLPLCTVQLSALSERTSGCFRMSVYVRPSAATPRRINPPPFQCGIGQHNPLGDVNCWNATPNLSPEGYRLQIRLEVSTTSWS